MGTGGGNKGGMGGKTTAVTEVVARIKELILEGDLPENGRLPAERDLAERMNVSRPTIREAIRALSLLGIVENRPGSGTYLVQKARNIPQETLELLFLINKSAIFDIFEARKGLETWVVSLAARRRTDDDLARMEAALKGMEAAIDDFKGYTRHEAEFHRVVFHSARNMVITHLMERLYGFWAGTESEIRELASDPEVLWEDFQLHRQLFEFIREGNEQGAQVTMLYDLLLFERKLKKSRLTNGEPEK